MDEGEGMEQAIAEVPALGPEEVYAAIAGAMNVSRDVRGPAEQAIKTWEGDAAPGFIHSLIRIVEQADGIAEEYRLLAAVVAKNAVGSSWRKTLGTREWSRVPDAEKAAVRESATRLLFSDRSERVALQLALLITNIARFDFPGHWQSLLQDLASAMAWEAPSPWGGKRRAAVALKNVVRALRSKRIVVETPTPAHKTLSQAELKPLAELITQERRTLHDKAEAVFPHAVQEWQQHFAALLSGSSPESAEVRGELGNRCLQVLRELLYLLPNWENLEAPVRQLLQGVHQATTAINAAMPPGTEPAGVSSSMLLITSKAIERMIQCVMAALDRSPLEFAAYLPFFLELYCTNALVGMDAVAVHRIRSKRRVLLTRFLARALLCPYYRPEWTSQDLSDHTPQEAREKLAEGQRKARVAEEALTRLLANGEGQCSRLLEAIITKYVALTPEEVEEWQVDPESYVRSMDVESSPDADTPRPCGVALLLCMLERGGDGVAAVMVQLAAQLQAQPPSPTTLLLREATYRALGEGYAHVAQQVNFRAWYSAELRALLAAPAAPDTHQSMLRARAIWLVGVCGADLPADMWTDAYTLVVQHLGDADLVVALHAVAALSGLTAGVLEEETARMAGVEAAAGAALGGAFGVLGRLSEAESMIRVLQLVSILVEVLGGKLAAHLGSIAAALPQVWSATAEHRGAGGETGALARLHSALIAVLTHLINRLGTMATAHPQVQSVLFPLLRHALDVGGPEGDVLVEEGVRLLQATLAGCPDMPPPLLELVPGLLAIMRRGQDNAGVYGALESYLLLGGPQVLEPHQAAIAAALHRSISEVNVPLKNGQQQQQQDQQQQAAAGAQSQQVVRGGAGTVAPRLRQSKPPAAPAIATEASQEAQAAASLASVLLMLLPDQAPALLEASLRAMAQFVASTDLLQQSQGGRSLQITEAFLEVMGRLLFHQPHLLPALLNQDVEAQARFLDRWLAIAATRYLEEVLGVPSVTVLARLRRHIAAAALCAAACAAPPPLADARRAAKLLALGLRAMAEEDLFRQDEEEIKRVAAECNPTDPFLDHVMLQRLRLAAVEPVRKVELAAAVQAAAAACAQRVESESELLEAIGFLDGRLEQALRNVLQGGPGPNAAGQPLLA